MSNDSLRPYLAVAWLFFVCGAGNTNVLARLPTLREQLALSEQTLGLVLLAAAAGALTAFRIAGPLMQRFGSRPTASMAATLFCMSLCLPALAWGPWSAASGFAAMGATSGLMDVSMNVQGLVVERRRRMPIMSTLHACASLGGLLGAASGATAAHLRLSPLLHFTALAVLLAPTCALTRLLLLDEAFGTTAQPAAPLKRPHAALITLGFVAFCSSVGEGAMADWIAIYLREALHAEIGAAGLGFVAFSLTMVLGRLWGDRIGAHLGAPRVIAVGGLVAGSGLALGLVLNSFASMLLGAALAGFGLAPIVPTVLRTGGQLYPSQASRALANIATLSYGGFLLGPPCIGFVAQHAGLRFGLVVVVVAAMMMAMGARFVPGASRDGP